MPEVTYTPSLPILQAVLRHFVNDLQALSAVRLCLHIVQLQSPEAAPPLGAWSLGQMTPRMMSTAKMQLASTSAAMSIAPATLFFSGALPPFASTRPARRSARETGL